MKRFWAVGLISVLAGCPSDNSNDAGTGGGFGGGFVATGGGSGGGPSDAGSRCGCEVNGGLLTMSWECFCGDAGCAGTPPTTCGAANTTTIACGLRSDTIQTPGGPFIRVFDSSGALVGMRTGSDTGEYACPDDASLHAYHKQAGTFPAAHCTEHACDCTNTTVDCSGARDAGSCGCEVSGNSMTMSWECFCSAFGCDNHPSNTCTGPYDTSALACGLRVDERYPPERSFVFDGQGTQVGGSIHSDTGRVECPDNAAMFAATALAGVFPDAGCAKTECACADGGVSCP